MSAYSKLRRRHQLFADAFVRLGVACDAYREVFPEAKRPDVGAYKLMVRPGVKEAIEERTQVAIARAGVRQVRILEELAAIAFHDLAEFFDEDGCLRPLKDIPKTHRAALLGLETEELYAGRGDDRLVIGSLRKVRMHSKIEALKLLGQFHKMFAERHELTGKDGAPIETKDVSELSELDRARRVAFLLAEGLREAQAASNLNPGDSAADSTAPSNKQET